MVPTDKKLFYSADIKHSVIFMIRKRKISTENSIPEWKLTEKPLLIINKIDKLSSLIQSIDNRNKLSRWSEMGNSGMKRKLFLSELIFLLGFFSLHLEYAFDFKFVTTIDIFCKKNELEIVVNFEFIDIKRESKLNKMISSIGSLSINFLLNGEYECTSHMKQLIRGKVEKYANFGNRTFLKLSANCYFNFVCSEMSVFAFRVNSEYAKMTEIIPGLFICGVSSLNSSSISHYGITHIINATNETNIYPHLEQQSDLIRTIIADGGKVLVHCVAGVSRSASICLAYLTKYHCRTLRDAYHLMSKKRSLHVKKMPASVRLIHDEMQEYGLLPDVYLKEVISERSEDLTKCCSKTACSKQKLDEKYEKKSSLTKPKFHPVLESLPEMNEGNFSSEIQECYSSNKKKKASNDVKIVSKINIGEK
ncbi:hypothetical protein X798_06829 [Onchocerca flexuosa]|uniref:Tyrosine specific protein phosphatases domain-containing protein n=1 Tax=Onchocerca flexuosa TaxID=387005 RepID=A0A238BL80_9BILA|nr:hypothetical protein X798_06829 [Onchocerca flexuosa]